MFLRNLWYFAMPGHRLKSGACEPKVMLGEPVLVGRAANGEPFALRNICPHRGVPLRRGQFDGNEVECCYHEWRFDTAGRCTAIPSLTEGQSFDLGQITVRRYACRDVQGNIWVFMDDGNKPIEPLPSPPQIPDIGERQPDIARTVNFPSLADHAVVGLMDPAHGPFVHQAWWWRKRHSIHEKSKQFAPSHLGFTMVRHAPSTNSAAYRILGGDITTEISFQLPGIRIEQVRAGTRMLCGLTAVTPIDATQSDVNHVIYWTMPWLTPLKPIVQYFAGVFLNQDRNIVVLQQEGLKFDPTLSLIDDADTQAKWYYRLKREWQSAEEEGREFKNPVQETVLRWRS